MTIEPTYCMVEIPTGSRNKYEWNERRQAITLDRFLFSSVVYPTDYGFIPDTLGEDCDPLDAMVCVSEPTFPGCLIPVKQIALFKMRDDKGVDDKILCVPLHDPNWNGIESLKDLSLQLRDEISNFFSIYKTLEGKVVNVRRLVCARVRDRGDRTGPAPMGRAPNREAARSALPSRLTSPFGARSHSCGRAPRCPSRRRLPPSPDAAASLRVKDCACPWRRFDM